VPRLEGLHHVTAITGDAPANVDFYAGVLGLRLVKKTVNYDAPEVYHLYYGDERGSPGSVMTFFEYPGARPGRAGAGMVHAVSWRVGSDAALDFWAARLEDAGRPVERSTGSLASSDPEGLDFELVAVDVPDPPLTAAAPDVPPEHALRGFHGVRAFARRPEDSERLLAALNFEPVAGGLAHRVGGERRHATYVYDHAPAAPGIAGGGTVHDVAWASRDEDHDAWRTVVQMAGARPTEIIDRTYFRSIYFREPSGVLFEIATLSPGFVVDEPWETLGESLVLPPQHESRREELERTLTPVTNPRPAYGSTSPS
jgi:glyoxalase family protein